MRRALSLTFKLTMETTIMIESLIEILEQTPTDTLCDGGVRCYAVECNKCPFLSNASKDTLIEELKELLNDL